MSLDHFRELGSAITDAERAKERFITTPLAVAHKVVDLATKVPTDIRAAMQKLSAGYMPRNTGVVKLGGEREPEASLDLIAFRREGGSKGLILPMSKQAVNEQTKAVQADGYIMLANTSGLYTPVAEVVDLNKGNEVLLADFDGIPLAARLGSFAIRPLAFERALQLEAVGDDAERGIVEVKPRKNYK